MSPLNALGPDTVPEVPPKELEPFVFGDPDSDNHGRPDCLLMSLVLLSCRKKPRVSFWIRPTLLGLEIGWLMKFYFKLTFIQMKYFQVKSLKIWSMCILL